ncbi:hypothetical protein [Kitasatospora sp. A2-31]|uniref:hypothetical protein n=1 Tax=Kitasatospora sp. A2-31 TaxID=2916414 RepID=UPI001EED563C|nr:hypothetical protein [Kitasatospora sp. A2-31]MCG6499458.1 hypothetical protein [Kitasatospora sp. A2-31]
MPDTIHVRGEGGMVIAMDLPLPEPIAERLVKGQLTRVNEDGSPYVEAPTEGVPSLPDKPPAKTDPKATWVGWAVANGADPDEADGMTKGDLIEAYGAE